MAAASRFGVTVSETAAGAGLRTTNPPSGEVASTTTFARTVSRKFGAEALDVTRHRCAELIDESPAIEADEVSLSGDQLVLPDTHGVPLALVICNPLDPVRDRYIRAHIRIDYTRILLFSLS